MKKVWHYTGHPYFLIIMKVAGHSKKSVDFKTALIIIFIHIAAICFISIVFSTTDYATRIWLGGIFLILAVLGYLKKEEGSLLTDLYGE